MNACSVSLETLLNYRERRLPSSEEAALRAHLDVGCPSCTANLAALGELTDRLARSDFEAPSHQAVATASGILGRRRPRPSLTRWLARQVPLSPTLAPGLRGDGNEPVQLLFETDAHDVDFSAEVESEGTYYLIGQVRSRESAATIVAVWAHLSSSDHRTTDKISIANAAGEFHFSGLPAGAYTATIHLPDGVLDIGPIALPEAP